MSAMPLTDAVFLLAETREQPIHVGGLHLYKPPPDAEPDVVGDFYRQVLQHREVIPRLRRRPTRMAGFGPWAWADDPDLDLEYHIRHSALPSPGRVRELLALVSRLHGTLLDRTRPLWESHLIEGLSDGRFATYTKIHHALIDGVGAMRLLERSLTTDPDARDLPPPFAPRERVAGAGRTDKPGRSPLSAATSLVGMGVDGIRGALGAGDAAMRSFVKSFNDEATTFPFKAPASALNVPVTGARRFAADAWDLERLRMVGKKLGGTVNDVVLAMSAGALRAYLMDLGTLPDAPLIAMVPVSLRGEDDDEDASNAVGLILCNLGTHLENPLDRFALVHESAQAGKLELQGLNQAGIIMLSAMSFAPLGLGPLYRFEPLRRPPFNIVISNVPGPRERLYWNGAELDGMYPASIPIHGQAMNITCTSYADRMSFGVVGCRRAAPSLQRLLEHLEESLCELEAVA